MDGGTERRSRSVQQEYSFQPLAKQNTQKEPLQQVIHSRTSLISPEAPPSKSVGSSVRKPVEAGPVVSSCWHLCWAFSSCGTPRTTRPVAEAEAAEASGRSPQRQSADTTCKWTFFVLDPPASCYLTVILHMRGRWMQDELLEPQDVIFVFWRCTFPFDSSPFCWVS